MHIVKYFVPFYGMASAVAAKHGIGRVECICFDIIANLAYYFRAVMAFPIFAADKTELAHAAGIQRKLGRIALHGRNGRKTTYGGG